MSPVHANDGVRPKSDGDKIRKVVEMLSRDFGGGQVLTDLSHIASRLDVADGVNAELLAACEALLERMKVNELGGPCDRLPYDRPAVLQAEAAIKKAKGDV